MSCALLGSAGLSIRSPSVHRQVLGYERISCGFLLHDLPGLKNLSNMITTRVVPRCKYGGEETGGKYVHCLVFVFYPLRSTEIGYPWPNKIPCPGMDDGWMALFGVTRLIILIIGLLCYYFLSIFFKLLWLFPTALALVTNRVPCHFVRYTV